MRIEPDRRETVDHRKLARALLHLAQADYDSKHPESSSNAPPDSHRDIATDADPANRE